MSNDPTSDNFRDARVMELYEELLEIEQRLIPTGLHVLGCPSVAAEKADLLKMVASFDRPEFGARSLPGLVTEALKLTGADSNERTNEITSVAIRKVIDDGADRASDYLATTVGLSGESTQGMLRLVARISESLNTNGEIDAVLRALRGEFIEPGPGADIVQNPSILPTGRNTHAINPYGVPSDVAFAR
ncbi:MAG TPA: cobaltochelatase subunit CobN, partial [Pyrinomonadaceae bacterium]|nr:cobaltochelatase subunit CobN [Pyrinomonadaceae bacterium]